MAISFNKPPTPKPIPVIAASIPDGYKLIDGPSGPVLVPLSQGAQVQEVKVAEVAVPQVVAKPKTATTAMTEEMIDLHAKFEKLGGPQIVARMDELKKSLQSIAADSGADPEKPYTFVADNGTVVYSAAKKMTVITDGDIMLDLLEKASPGAPALIAKYNLGDIKKYLSAHDLAKITKAEYGARSLSNISVKPED